MLDNNSFLILGEKTFYGTTTLAYLTLLLVKKKERFYKIGLKQVCNPIMSRFRSENLTLYTS
jgi:hypothetical protein